MKADITKYLNDILSAIEIIHFHISDTITFEQFESDLTVLDAVERRLMIIGEALNEAIKLDKNLTVTNKTDIIKLRHLLVHHYSNSDYAILWNIIHTDLPTLKREVEILLNNYNGSSGN